MGNLQALSDRKNFIFVPGSKKCLHTDISFVHVSSLFSVGVFPSGTPSNMPINRSALLLPSGPGLTQFVTTFSIPFSPSSEEQHQ